MNRKTGSNRFFRLPFAALLCVALAGGMRFQRAWAEGKNGDDGVPDLEEVIKGPGGAGGGGGGGGSKAVPGDADTESLSDLEKVIETEDAKGPVAKAPRRSAASSGPGTKSNPPPRSQDEPVTIPDEPSSRPVPEKPGSARIESNDLPEPESEPVNEPKRPPSRRNGGGGSRSATNERNVIQNLEFKMEGLNSRLVLTARNPLRYREIKNPGMRQVIYYFDNTETPERLQRAYDTTEFASAVALFTLLQMPKETPPTSKLIVQLREDKSPTVIATERGLYIDFAPPTKGVGGDGSPRLVIGDNDRNKASEENLYLNNTTFTGRVIKRLEIKNSDVQDVLRLIAKTSGLNIVVGDDVTGKVGTLSLENIPWDQAFALVLQSKKLGYVKQGNVIRVATLTSLKTEKDEALSNENAKIKVESLRTVLIPISYAKASELAPQAKNFLTERGTIDTDVRTNTVIVKDIDRVVNRVQKLFAALDTQPPRVAISAKIVEMGTNFSRNIGSAFSFKAETSGLNLTQNNGFSAGGQSVTTISAANFGQLQATFDLAESEEKLKTLANPSVTVVANRQATVSQSVSFFVPANEVAGGQLVASSRQVTTTLTLDVTPIVTGDGSIFMNVSVKNEIPHLAGANTTIDARAVTTQVLIENGDTAVVGGVFQNTVNKGKSGIPFLMRVPVIGTLFGKDTLQDNRNEIFIFITAKITNAEESFKRSF